MTRATLCAAALVAARFPIGTILMAAADTVASLQARLQELDDQNTGIVNAADEHGADLTDEELSAIEANRAEMERIQRQITARQAARPAAGPGRRTPAEPSNGAAPGPTRIAAQPRANDRTGGFRNLGEFASCVFAAHGRRDEGAIGRLTNTLGMNEGVGEDGGFLVPAEFRDGIMKIVEGEESLLPRTDNSTTSRNSVIHTIDRITPWGTSGIQATWEGEGQSTTATGAKFEQNTLRLNKLMARVDASDELLDDAPQLDSYLRVKAPEVMTSVINLAIVQGNGVGKPLGFMNSGALVTISKETSQPADTIMHRNLVKMMGRMYAPSWARATWLMHQDIWAQLPLISFRDIGAYPSTATGSAVPAYMPPTGIAGQPYGTLFGRPIMVLEAMETIGDLGDIALVDLKAYRTVTKAGGTRVDTSIHLKFDTDETVFRFIFRVAGAPWWSSTISPRDGSNTRSPFITLESR